MVDDRPNCFGFRCKPLDKLGEALDGVDLDIVDPTAHLGEVADGKRSLAPAAKLRKCPAQRRSKRDVGRRLLHLVPELSVTSNRRAFGHLLLPGRAGVAPNASIAASLTR